MIDSVQRGNDYNVKNGIWRLAGTMGLDSVAALCGLEFLRCNRMTDSPSHDTTLRHRSAGFDMTTAFALNRKMISATAVQNDEESPAAATNHVEDEKRAGNSESVMRKSSQVTCADGITVLADVAVWMRSKGTEVVESRMHNVH